MLYCWMITHVRKQKWTKTLHYNLRNGQKHLKIQLIKNIFDCNGTLRQSRTMNYCNAIVYETNYTSVCIRKEIVWRISTSEGFFIFVMSLKDSKHTLRWIHDVFVITYALFFFKSGSFHKHSCYSLHAWNLTQYVPKRSPCV